jgi:hypothetical protein
MPIIGDPHSDELRDAISSSGKRLRSRNPNLHPPSDCGHLQVVVYVVFG